MHDLELQRPPVVVHGDTATHNMINVHPRAIQPRDIYRHKGNFRTVSQALELDDGGVALYFTEPTSGAPNRAVIPEGTMGVTVYRPQGSGDSYV